jgi:uncharacterized protein YdbL (DUF1318 family)
MLDILTSYSDFEIENNIILPPVTVDPPVTKQAKKQDKQQSFLINNHSGRSTEFKILDFLPSFLIINTDQRVIELFILNKKVCNIFNISEQTVNYEQWTIENNGINQSIIYDDKKIVTMLNKSVDSFYRFIGGNPDIFPKGINKLTPYRLRVNHKLGGHFIVTKENKTKNQLILTTTKQDQQKLITFLNEVVKDELLKTQKELTENITKKTQKLTKIYDEYKYQLENLNNNNSDIETNYLAVIEMNLSYVKQNLRQEQNQAIEQMKLGLIANGFLPFVVESTKEYMDRLKGINRTYNAKYRKIKQQIIDSTTKLTINDPDNITELRTIKNELTTLKIKLTKLSDKIAKIDNFNFAGFTNSLKSKINFKDKLIFSLMNEVNKLSYLNTDDKVKKANLRDIKKNIKRIFLISLSGNNHLRPMRLVTNNLNLDIEEMILVCLTNTNNNGLPYILDSQLSNEDYIVENNRYLKPYNCYFESV